MVWQGTGIALATLLPGSTREVMVGATSILVANLGTTVSAVEATCPHIGGLLADGTLEGRHLTCPEHAAVFDVADGKVVADPFGVQPPEGGVDPIKVYPVRVTSGMIEIDLP